MIPDGKSQPSGAVCSFTRWRSDRTNALSSELPFVVKKYTLPFAVPLLGLALVSGTGPLFRALPSVSEPPTARPNVVILLADDLGYGDLGCYGNPVIQTPYLDRLAASGLKLTHCYASSPVCSPSRAGLLTGKTPTRLGIHDWIPENSVVHLRRGETTIARLLQQAGYQTGFFGKWHLNGFFNQPQHPQPSDHGFDYCFATQHNARPSHRNPQNFVRNGQPLGTLEGYACQIVADEVANWLQNRDKTRPFFQHVCFHEPHELIASPEEWVNRYAGATPPERAVYHASVSNLDAAVGKILAALEREGVRDNTLVIFTSDNGPNTNNGNPGTARSYGTAGPLRGRKLWLYEGGIRVPGIVSWPGRIAPNQVSDAPTSNLDFLPTLAALAGVKVSTDSLDGVDLSPQWVRQRAVRRSKPLFWFYYNALDRPRVAMREGDYKLVGIPEQPVARIPATDVPGENRKIKSLSVTKFELYDLRADPAETRDLAPSNPRQARVMAARMQQRQREVLAESPDW